MTFELIQRLRLQPEDEGGPSRMDMLRERAEAADELQRLCEQMERAAIACAHGESETARHILMNALAQADIGKESVKRSPARTLPALHRRRHP